MWREITQMWREIERAQLLRVDTQIAVRSPTSSAVELQNLPVVPLRFATCMICLLLCHVALRLSPIRYYYALQHEGVCEEISPRFLLFIDGLPSVSGMYP